MTVQRLEALVLRTGARALLGKTDEAMRDVDAVLDKMPEHQVAIQHKGLLLLKKGLPAEARKCFESIHDPAVRSDSVLPLAEAHLESGDANAAIALLKGRFNLDPPEREDLGRAELLLRAEAAAGTEDSVGPALDEAIGRHPNDPTLFTLASVLASLKGDSEASITALTKATEMASDRQRPALQSQLGKVYASLERYEEAAEQFSRACGEDASHPAAVLMLLSLFNSRQYRKTIDLARQIRESKDQLPKVVVDVEAEVLGYVGDAKTELSRLQELCSRDDCNPDDQIRLALAHFPVRRT